MSENVNEENPHNSEDEVDQSFPATPRRLSRTLDHSSGSGSFVWYHFTKDSDYKNNKKANCSHCNKTYICSGGSTSELTKHLKNVHNIVQQNQSKQTGETNVFMMLQASKVNAFYFLILQVIFKFKFNFINSNYFINSFSGHLIIIK
jgi:hypothetical protein